VVAAGVIVLLLGSIVAAVADAGGWVALSGGRAPVATVSCDQVIIGVATSGQEPGMRRVLGVVSAPRSYLSNVGSDPSAAPFRFWTKAGIEIRSGSAVTVTVGRLWQNRVHISWGGEEGPSLRFAPCSLGTSWNAYAGGFLSRSDAICVPLIFSAVRLHATLLFGVGRHC
jgi:hypothetical protein